MNARTALFLLVIGMCSAGPCVPAGAAGGPDEARADLRLRFTQASFRPADPAAAAKTADGAASWAAVAAAARDYDAFLRDFPTLTADGVSERVRRLARTLAVGDDEVRRVLPLYLARCAVAPGGLPSAALPTRAAPPR